jgi:hypothetical protein
VDHAQLCRRLCGPVIVSQQNDLAPRKGAKPALDGVSLNQADVTAERLGDREERDLMAHHGGWLDYCELDEP